MLKQKKQVKRNKTEKRVESDTSKMQHDEICFLDGVFYFRREESRTLVAFDIARKESKDLNGPWCDVFIYRIYALRNTNQLLLSYGKIPPLLLDPISKKTKSLSLLSTSSRFMRCSEGENGIVYICEYQEGSRDCFITRHDIVNGTITHFMPCIIPFWMFYTGVPGFVVVANLETMILVDVCSMKKIEEVEVENVKHCTFAKDYGIVMLKQDFQTIHVYSAETLKFKYDLPFEETLKHRGRYVQNIVISEDGRYLLICNPGPWRWELWDLHTQKRLPDAIDISNSVSIAWISRQDKRIYTFFMFSELFMEEHVNHDFKVVYFEEDVTIDGKK